MNDTPTGFAGLSQSRKIWFAVSMLDQEVYNGGIEQFFFNQSAEYFEVVVLGLREIGAKRALDLLLEAQQLLFPECNMPSDTGVRRQALLRHARDAEISGLADHRSAALSRINRDYGDDPDGLAERLLDFAVRNGLISQAAIQRYRSGTSP